MSSWTDRPIRASRSAAPKPSALRLSGDRTIVAFDRIRENFIKLRGATAEDAMNVSINEMLARTIITGVTTLLVLVALLVLGGESVGPFAIALIVGIVVGTYSSIYTASAAALFLDVTAQDLLPPEIDPELIDDLP